MGVLAKWPCSLEQAEDSAWLSLPFPTHHIAFRAQGDLYFKPGVVEQVCNPSTHRHRQENQESEARLGHCNEPLVKKVRGGGLLRDMTDCECEEPL